MAILDVQHIEKHFGDTSVLKDISFSLEEGQASPSSAHPAAAKPRCCGA